MRGSLRDQGSRNRFQHTFYIADDVIVPKTENRIIPVAQPSIAYPIALAVSMLTAVDFNNQSLLATKKINNVATDRLLTNELMSID